MTLAETWNADFIDAQYRLWKAEPDGLSQDWQFFFQGFELARSAGPGAEPIGDGEAGMRQYRVNELIHRHRDIGHLLACLDPLEACPVDHPLLNPEAFELAPEDLEREFYAQSFFESGRAKLRDIIQALRETYCRSIGVEFMHLQDPGERQWLLNRLEPARNRTVFDNGTRKRILAGLFRSARFEAFLNKKYVGVTRFSLEGADALIPAMEYLADRAARLGCTEIILGMAHRGRLNVLAHFLGKPYEEIFSEFENCYNPEELTGAGDVKYHNGYLGDIRPADDLALRIFLMNNPSHLESVNPVVEGFARGRRDILGSDRSDRVLPLLIHGDAAFAGQGIVAETLNMSQLEGYKTGRHSYRHQQSDRLYHAAGRCPIDPLCDRYGKNAHGPDLPRSWRRPGGGAACHCPGNRIQMEIRQRRGCGPGLLPSLRA